MKVDWSRWPVWNYHFPELDVRAIVSVNYFDKDNTPQILPAEEYRLTIGQKGVSGLFLINKGTLPDTFDRPDAVSCEYEA